MLSLTECKKILADEEISDDYFLRLHFCAEAVIRRLFLIGLRLQGVQYAIAETIAEEYHAGSLKDRLEMAFNFCGISYKKIKATGKYGNYEKLFFSFTSRWRNRRVHGLEREITRPDLLKMLITADKRFVAEIEAAIKKMDKPSLFDKPEKWGAKKVPEKDLPLLMETLFGDTSAPAPLSMEKAAALMK